MEAQKFKRVTLLWSICVPNLNITCRDKKTQILKTRDLRWLGSLKVNDQQSTHNFLFTFHINYCLAPFARHIKLFVQNCNFFPNHMYLLLLSGMTPVEFYQDIWSQKIKESPGEHAALAA